MAKAAEIVGGLSDCVRFLARSNAGVGLAVMLLAVDAVRFLVLLAGKSVAVLRGEVAVVLGAHAVLFTVDAGLLMLHARGFARRKLAAPDALRDTRLLIALACGDVVTLVGVRLGERS
jgi:hypothetical protein